MEYTVESHKGIDGDYNFALLMRIPAHELVVMKNPSFQSRMWFAWTCLKGFWVTLRGLY